jgi:hypothetical protein
MTTKFKAGDRVKCIETRGFVKELVLGKDYTVRRTYGPYLYFEDEGGGWDASRFELATPAPKFKKGDRVRCTHSTPPHWSDGLMQFIKGDVYTVSADCAGNTLYVDKDNRGHPNGWCVDFFEPATAFKTGDKVRFTRLVGRIEPGTEGTIQNADNGLAMVRLPGRSLIDYAVVFAHPSELELVEAKVVGTPHIVIVEQSGKLKPAWTPVVHTSKDAAEKEALRLAEANPGQTFKVFPLSPPVASAFREVPKSTTAKLLAA